MGRHGKKKWWRGPIGLWFGLLALLWAGILAAALPSQSPRMPVSAAQSAPAHHVALHPRKPQEPSHRHHGAPAAVSYIIHAGDSLWGVAERLCRSGSDWPALYRANVKMIGINPGMIFAGETLTVKC